MKKHLIAASLAMLMMPAATLAAPNLAVSAVNGLAQNITPEHKQMALEFLQQQLSEHWQPTAKGLTEAQEQRQRATTLPEKAFFGDTKQDAYDEINSLYKNLFQDMLDEDIQSYRNKLQKHDAEIAQYSAEIADMKANLAFVFEQQEIDQVRTNVKRKEQQLYSAEQQRNAVLQGVSEQLGLHGVFLSNKEIEALLSRVNSDDMMAAMTVFPIMREMVSQLAVASQNASGNLQVAKRYYGLFSELIALQLYIYDQFEDRLTYNYIPKLERMRFESERLVRETKQLLANATPDVKPIYEANIKSQLINLKAVDLYSKVLKKDRERFNKSKLLVQNKKQAADNTLATVSNSQSIGMLIKDSTAMFDSVIALSTPEIIVFDNSALEAEFAQLTLRLQAE
ncbi:hypothetical protein [Ferrimonas senticii]|uniref:hypothetical protein n=1 Tax=Ferrimonas senticii TaxID=394566 RepID=UPI0004090C0A|nr:hypothetical protein [Ferrimonas senticii]